MDPLSAQIQQEGHLKELFRKNWFTDLAIMIVVLSVVIALLPFMSTEVRTTAGFFGFWVICLTLVAHPSKYSRGIDRRRPWPLSHVEYLERKFPPKFGYFFLGLICFAIAVCLITIVFWASVIYAITGFAFMCRCRYWTTEI